MRARPRSKDRAGEPRCRDNAVRRRARSWRARPCLSVGRVGIEPTTNGLRVQPTYPAREPKAKARKAVFPRAACPPRRPNLSRTWAPARAARLGRFAILLNGLADRAAEPRPNGCPTPLRAGPAPVTSAIEPALHRSSSQTRLAVQPALTGNPVLAASSRLWSIGQQPRPTHLRPPIIRLSRPEAVSEYGRAQTSGMSAFRRHQTRRRAERR